jgi:hypothetical protein
MLPDVLYDCLELSRCCLVQEVGNLGQVARTKYGREVI